MYRLKDIQDNLKHLVGWRQSYDQSKLIDSELTQSESGLYVQDAHPLCTLDNIRSIMPDDYGLQYDEWNEITTYNEGRIVKHGDILWKALGTSKGEEPIFTDFSTDFNDDFGNPIWHPYTLLSDYLETLTYQGISKMIQNFFDVKKIRKETKSLLEHRTFFDGTGRLKAVINNTHKLVGFEINPVRSMGVTTKLEKIGLQMKGATGNVRVYLFHSSQYEPIKTIDLNFSKTNGGFQWFDMSDMFLPYISEGNNSGGSWYLCYDQNELPLGMEAVNFSKDWSREPCGTCNQGSVIDWRELTKYLQVSPFAYPTPNNFTNNPMLWDIASNIYTNTTNYGFNCQVSVACDITDTIISQSDMFQSVLQKQIAEIILEQLAMNPNVRVNRNQLNASKAEIMYELDGGETSRGLKKELEQSYRALEIDTQGMDRICLSCNNGGVRYRSI